MFATGDSELGIKNVTNKETIGVRRCLSDDVQMNLQPLLFFTLKLHIVIKTTLFSEI